MRVQWALAAILISTSPAWAADTVPATVTTHATARERLANTVADVTLAIEARGKTVPEVQKALSDAAGPLTAYLNQVKVERLRTQGVSVQPEMDPNQVRGQAPKIVGYRGRMSLTFQMESAKLGEVLAGALDHGANAIDQTALHPREAESDAARARLAASATKIALQQAQVVAEAAGRHAGPVRGIVVDGADPVLPKMLPLRSMAAPAPAAMAAGPILPMETGDSEVSAGVTVTVVLTEP